MSDTTTITPEERALWFKDAQPKSVGHYEPIDFEMDKRIRRLLTALEAAEARAEKAESDKAALEEDLEATEKNLKESSGFIEELLSGLKHRFPVQYADLEGDEYGDDAFSSHDLFELVIDPAVNAAQEAEAENAMLRAERDWLATQLACIQSAYDIDQKTRDWSTARWAEAARRAVAAGEG